MARMVGSTPADMAGTDIFNFIDPDSQEAAAQDCVALGMKLKVGSSSGC